MIKAVLFDFFGTLVDIDKDAPRLWESLQKLGYDGSQALEEVWNSDGFNGMETPSISDIPGYDEWRYNNLRMMATHAGVPIEKRDEVVKHIDTVDRSFTVKAKVGATEVVNHLSRNNILTGICSNWDSDFLHYYQQSKLPLVNTIITSAQVGARKPHKKPFYSACTSLGVSPSESLFVGDDWNTDVIGSLRSGLTPIWLTQFKDNPLPNLVITIEEIGQVLRFLFMS